MSLEVDDLVDGPLDAASFDAMMLAHGLLAGVQALGDFSRPAVRRRAYEAVLERLDGFVDVRDVGGPPLLEISTPAEGIHHTVRGQWARAATALGELEREGGQFAEATSAFRKALRTWSLFNLQSQVALVVALAFTAAQSCDKEVCLAALEVCDALGVCDALEVESAQQALLDMSRALARVRFGPRDAANGRSPESFPVDVLHRLTL